MFHLNMQTRVSFEYILFIMLCAGSLYAAPLCVALIGIIDRFQAEQLIEWFQAPPLHYVLTTGE